MKLLRILCFGKPQTKQPSCNGGIPASTPLNRSASPHWSMHDALNTAQLCDTFQTFPSSCSGCYEITEDSPEPSELHSHVLDLPADVLLNILSRLNPSAMRALSTTCTQLNTMTLSHLSVLNFSLSNTESPSALTTAVTWLNKKRRMIKDILPSVHLPLLPPTSPTTPSTPMSPFVTFSSEIRTITPALTQKKNSTTQSHYQTIQRLVRKAHSLTHVSVSLPSTHNTYPDAVQTGRLLMTVLPATSSLLEFTLDSVNTHIPDSWWALVASTQPHLKHIGGPISRNSVSSLTTTLNDLTGLTSLSLSAHSQGTVVLPELQNLISLTLIPKVKCESEAVFRIRSPETANPAPAALTYATDEGSYTIFSSALTMRAMNSTSMASNTRRERSRVDSPQWMGLPALETLQIGRTSESLASHVRLDIELPGLPMLSTLGLQGFSCDPDLLQKFVCAQTALQTASISFVKAPSSFTPWGSCPVPQFLSQLTLQEVPLSSLPPIPTLKTLRVAKVLPSATFCRDLAVQTSLQELHITVSDPSCLDDASELKLLTKLNELTIDIHQAPNLVHNQVLFLGTFPTIRSLRSLCLKAPRVSESIWEDVSRQTSLQLLVVMATGSTLPMHNVSELTRIPPLRALGMIAQHLELRDVPQLPSLEFMLVETWTTPSEGWWGCLAKQESLKSLEVRLARGADAAGSVEFTQQLQRMRRLKKMAVAVPPEDVSETKGTLRRRLREAGRGVSLRVYGREVRWGQVIW